MGYARKPAFGVSVKARFNPARTSKKIENLLVASLDMLLSKKRITKALIRLRRCAGWSAPVLFANPRRQVFSRRGPYVCLRISHVGKVAVAWSQDLRVISLRLTGGNVLYP